MTDIWNTDGGIYMGFARTFADGANGSAPLVNPLRYVGDRMICTVGPNGSGKSSRSLLINFAQLKNWSIVAVDSKGDHSISTAEHRAKTTKVIKLNPFNARGLGSDGFNPLAALDPKSLDFTDDSMGLSEATIRVEGKEPHFPETAQELLCGLIMYVRLVFPNPSLTHVRSLLALSSEAFKKLIITRNFDHAGVTVPGMIRAGMIHDCPSLENKAKRFVDIGPENRELLSVFSTGNTQTRWLDSPQIQTDISKGYFDFSSLRREPTTVYLVLPTKRLGTHSNWLRQIITAILEPLMVDTRPAKVPVLFMLDEFAQLGHLPFIERNMAAMRGYGIKLWTVVQDLSQISAIYGQRWESFLNNAGILQSFAPQDAFTSEYLSKLSGFTTCTPLSASNVGPDASLSMSQMQRPLLYPEQIRSMGEGMSLIYSHKLNGGVAVSYMPDPYRVIERDMVDKFFGVNEGR